MSSLFGQVVSLLPANFADRRVFICGPERTGGVILLLGCTHGSGTLKPTKDKAEVSFWSEWGLRFESTCSVWRDPTLLILASRIGITICSAILLEFNWKTKCIDLTTNDHRLPSE